MATGFIQRYKGKIATFFGGIWQNGVQSSAVFHNAGVPTNGAAGTLFGIAGPGALLVDITNKVLYQNTNTLLSPTWTALTTATGAGTYTGTFDGVVGGVTPAAVTATTGVFSGLVTNSAATGLTAHAGGTQAAALALTKQFNRLTTVATTADSVKLVAAVGGGQWQVIDNAGAAAAQVFGSGTDTIDGVATATGVPLTNAKRCLYVSYAVGAWISYQLGVVSA